MSTQNTPDETIVSAVIGGDIEQYATLIKRYETKLQRYVVYLIHDETTAYDTVQDTFIKAYQNLRSYNADYRFSSWIYRIAHNEAMNAVKRHKHVSNDDVDTIPDMSYESDLEDIVDSKILKTHIHSCLARLDPKYREVIQLVYFEHMKYEDIADVLRIPTSTVGVWLSRAKTKLRKLCEERGVTR